MSNKNSTVTTSYLFLCLSAGNSKIPINSEESSIIIGLVCTMYNIQRTIATTNSWPSSIRTLKEALSMAFNFSSPLLID